MKKFLLLAALCLSIFRTASAQTPTPTINGTPPPFTFTGAVTQTGNTFTFTGGSGTFVTLSGDATSTATGGATTVVGINGTLLSGLPSGFVYNTTGTGVPSKATATQLGTLVALPQYSIPYSAGTTSALTDVASPTVNGVYALGWTVVGSAAIAPAAITLGTAALDNTGTSGATIPLLNGANTYSAIQTFSVAPILTGLTGYVYANGSSQVGAATTIPLGSITSTAGTLAPLYLANATSGLITLEPATGAITSYTLQLPVAQPSGSNTYLSCTAANPAVCTWAAGGSGSSGLSGMTQYGLGVAATASTMTSSVQPASWTTGHTFVPAWQPSGSALAPISLDLATYLASPPAIGGTTQAAGSFSSVTIPGDGTHAAQLSLYPNTTAPTLTTGDASILGPNAASVTAYAWQMPTATNASAGILHVGANASAISQLTVSLIAVADLSATGTPSSTTFLRGDNTWATPSGSGTVTVVSSGNLTSTALVTGGGLQTLQTPSATSTLSSGGALQLAAGGSVGSLDTGAPTFNFATNKVTLNQSLVLGTTSNQLVAGTTTNLTTLTFPAPSGAVTLTFPITTEYMVGANSDTTTTHVLHATTVAGVGVFGAIAAGDLPTTLSTGITMLSAAEIGTNAEYSNGTCTTSKTITPANGNMQNVTLTNGDACALTFTQPTSGTASVTLKIIQSAVSTYNGTISGCLWPGGTVPTITATTGAVDFVSVYLDGTHAYCAALQNFK